MSQASFDLDQPQGLRTVDSPAVGKHHSKAKPAEKKAALAIVPKSGTQRHTILKCVVDAGQRGRTQWEVIERTNILRSSVCARMNELEEGGWVRHGGTTRRAGAHESLYFATTRGIRAMNGLPPSPGSYGNPASSDVKANQDGSPPVAPHAKGSRPSPSSETA